MPVRSTMANLILRVRLLFNDTLPVNAGQIFTDQQVQDVLDASRQDVQNQVLRPLPTFSGTQIEYLDYYAELGDWEDDLVLKQYLINVVTPSLNEPIAGHWQFAATTLPAVYISGKTYDIYRAAADLIERQAAQWMLRYSVSVDGQSLQRSQSLTMMLDLAKTFRLQQRAHTIYVTRTDLRSPARMVSTGLGATELDYMGSGDGR